MNPFTRVERACARFVEDGFARVFPSGLEPAHLARKLVGVSLAAPSDLYLVRVNPLDYARFEHDRGLLEARWSALLREAIGANLETQAPRAMLHEDPNVVLGSVAIEAVAPERHSSYVLERGGEAQIVLRDGLRLGRAIDNDVILRDRRASRYHARIIAAGSAFAIDDLGSSNGTFVDGRPVTRETLAGGSTITLGDTQFRVRHLAG